MSSTLQAGAAQGPASFPGATPESANFFTPLRLILASLVIVAHAAEFRDGNASHEIFHLFGGKMTAGEYAVEAFFAISGYLILKSWGGNPQFGAYLKKRLLRIVPAFLTAYLISAFLVGWLGGGTTYFQELLRPNHIGELFLRMALLTYPATPPVFAGSSAPMVNGALWTISYEFRCYLLIPVLAVVGFYSRRLVVALVWLAIVLGVGISCAIHLRHPLELGLLRFVPFFLAGNCAYLYRKSIPWNRTLAVVCILASVLSMGSLLATRLVLPIAGSYAIFWMALSEASPLRHFSLSNDISYGVYLYGWPTQKLLLWYCPRLNLSLQVLLALGIATVLGWLSWQFIEKRCLRWKTSSSEPISSTVRIGPAMESA